MKRSICCIIMLLIMTTLFGCKNNNSDFTEPISFYYRNTAESYNNENAVLLAEVRESAGYDLASIISLYLQGPVTDACLSPFPTGVTLESVTIDGNTVHISLSEEFAELNGIKLTVACACVARTVIEFTQYQNVAISVPDALLNGNTSITISSQDLLLMDNSSQNGS